MARNMKMELHTFSLILYQSKKCGHGIHVLFMMYDVYWYCQMKKKRNLTICFYKSTLHFLTGIHHRRMGHQSKKCGHGIHVLFMMYDVYWYCQMKKKRIIMKILKKEWFMVGKPQCFFYTFYLVYIWHCRIKLLPLFSLFISLFIFLVVYVFVCFVDDVIVYHHCLNFLFIILHKL
jgi:hypothetical protein